MIDQQLKQKIVNTISQYEHKCSSLDNQIHNLYDLITRLSLLTTGLDASLDNEMDLLRTELSQDKPEPKAVQGMSVAITQLVDSFDEQKKNQRNLLIQSIRACMQNLRPLVMDAVFSRVEQCLNSSNDCQQILTEFSALLTNCSGQLPVNEHSLSEKMTHQVNQSLNQLLEHLAIPDELTNKLEQLKTNLQDELNDEKLVGLLDNLTALVTEAFRLNQNRFKEFLRDITNQISDFEGYLKQSLVSHTQKQKDTEALESGIQGNIQEIQSHLDTSKSLEELSIKVSKNLHIIGEKMRDYRENESQRIEEYEEQIHHLQEKLETTEKQAELVKHTLAVQKSRIYQDSLTGLANRASFDEHMQNSFDRWKLDRGDLCLAIADIDHFKKINDSYGHHAGDKVLKKVAAIIKSTIRPVDFIARYGGEEFILILQNTSVEESQVLLETLRLAVENYQFCYRDSPVIVTLSFGLACMRQVDTIESLFIRADEAMYAAKRAGRNRVESL